MKTKEEIIAKVCKYNNTHEMQLNDDITVEEAMECMEEYANQQLQLGGVVGRSEQLKCPRCSSDNRKLHNLKTLICRDCGTKWKF